MAGAEQPSSTSAELTTYDGFIDPPRSRDALVMHPSRECTLAAQGWENGIDELNGDFRQALRRLRQNPGRRRGRSGRAELRVRRSSRSILARGRRGRARGGHNRRRPRSATARVADRSDDVAALRMTVYGAEEGGKPFGRRAQLNTRYAITMLSTSDTA